MSEKPCRILIVDDSVEDRQVYRRRIAQDTSTAYEFLEASVGEEGLAISRRERPDCILLDYNLPDLNGLEFIERLRRQDGDAPTPVVMLTGQGNEAVAVDAIKKGAQDYLVKKVAGNDLRHIVHAAIDRVTLDIQLEERRKQVQQLAEERTRLIDQLQQQAAELREAARRKDEFLAVLAHELRNPLGPIRNATKILSLPPTTDCGHTEAREVIERQVAQMGRLIDDLLDVSRIARGKVLLRRERVDLAALARNCAVDHRQDIEAAGLTLALNLPDSPAWVNGDPTRLAQVIGNLLHNAAKFTDAGGTITLNVRGSDDSVVLTVIDTGIGMDADTLAHVFESFHQADTSLDRSRGGLGLGLALSKGLMELHGGRVNAESDGAGKGCRISFTVPAYEAAFTSDCVPAAKNSMASWRVLVIEDNLDAAKTLGALLRLYGHKSQIAHCGSQGLEAAREFRPEVVLCDIGLPGDMDGYDVARAIRGEADLQSMYLVAITGYGQEDDVQRARNAGFNLHMTKPVDPNRLENLLSTLSLPRQIA
ncbi:MAG TPA: response regulator [Humisphaera sp.]|jgi:signal transduction histidine kinase|nr:response regulator [Humisphaera sp.]